MPNYTSDHVKPCNIGQSEAHNRRTPEYIAHINKDEIYIRTDLVPHNEEWISSDMEGRNLQQYYDDIAIMVKEKTGRTLQTKERTITDKRQVRQRRFKEVRQSVKAYWYAVPIPRLSRLSFTHRRFKKSFTSNHFRYSFTKMKVTMRTKTILTHGFPTIMFI